MTSSAGCATLGAADVVEAASVAEARARTRLGPARDLLVVEVAPPGRLRASPS